MTEKLRKDIVDFTLNNFGLNGFVLDHSTCLYKKNVNYNDGLYQVKIPMYLFDRKNKLHFMVECLKEPPVENEISNNQLSAIVAQILKEVKTPGRPFASNHEAYAVLKEEVEGFWNEVKKKELERDYYRMKAELIQVAAVAINTILSWSKV